MPHDSPSTRPSLLLRIRDPQNREAWDEFVALYGPLLYRFGVRRGLQDSDAADLVQDVLVSVSGAIAAFEYDRALGAFRGWLHTIARNRLYRMQARGKRRPQATGDSALQEQLEQLPDASAGEQNEWERQYEQRLFEWAAELVRREVQAETWQAFRATAVENRPPAEVARELGMSVGAVYIAKSRVTARIREHIERVGV